MYLTVTASAPCGSQQLFELLADGAVVGNDVAASAEGTGAGLVHAPSPATSAATRARAAEEAVRARVIARPQASSRLSVP